MSIGTPTTTPAESTTGDRVYYDAISFAGDDAYVTGGTPDFDSVVQAALGDGRNVIGVISGDCGDHEVKYVPDAGATEGKLMVFLRSTGAEVANAADLSGTTFNVTVISK